MQKTNKQTQGSQSKDKETTSLLAQKGKELTSR